MPEKKVNRKHKDTLFRVIFGEHKDHALALYNAINKTDYTDVDQLKIISLEDALYIDIKNDVGYLFHDVLNLIEHQSTFSPNMPLRGLGYFADIYQRYVSDTYGDSAAVNSSRLLKLPAPKYYVFYNGETAREEETELRLSDAYNGAGDLEVVAHMVNINKGYSRALLDACEPLYGYSELIARIRSNKEKGLSIDESVQTAMESCIEDGILEDILRTERDKVANILYRGLTEAEKKKLARLELEYAEERGRSEARFEDVDSLITSGLAAKEKACEVLGVPLEDYNAYLEDKA